MTAYAIKGIPEELRGDVWLQCSGAQQVLIDPQFKNYYLSILSAFPDYPNPNFNQIELDLARTFPEEMGSPLQKHYEA